MERRTDCEMGKRFIDDEHVPGNIECVRVLRFKVVVCYDSAISHQSAL